VVAPFLIFFLGSCSGGDVFSLLMEGCVRRFRSSVLRGVIGRARIGEDGLFAAVQSTDSGWRAELGGLVNGCEMRMLNWGEQGAGRKEI